MGLAAVAVLALACAGVARGAEGQAGASPAPGSVLKDPKSGIELVFVKGGCYQMGDLWDDGEGGDGDGSQEKPVHEVCVDDFYIGKYEVTKSQWKAVLGTHPPANPSNCDDPECAQDNVSWSEVQEFLAKLNETSGAKRFRLPTEAEWEYAARSGGKAERYSGGNDVDAVSWYAMNSGQTDVPPKAVVGHRVGQKLPNGLGLHDMSGNVWELTSDWYSPTYYQVSPRENPPGPPSGEGHAMRGGGAAGHPGNSRTVRRSQESGPTSLLGFRVVRTP